MLLSQYPNLFKFPHYRIEPKHIFNCDVALFVCSISFFEIECRF